jgi:hypothetical protein
MDQLYLQAVEELPEIGVRSGAKVASAPSRQFLSSLYKETDLHHPDLSAFLESGQKQICLYLVMILNSLGQQRQITLFLPTLLILVRMTF